MFQWRYCVFGAGLVALSLLGIPVRFDPPGDDPPEPEKAFTQFVAKYNKSYASPEEYRTRFHTFKESLTIIETLNLKRSHPDSALYGVTQYCDLTQDEFQNTFLSINHVLSPKSRNSNSKKMHQHYHTNNHIRHKRVPPASNLPNTIDWRTKDVVTAVYNQKHCGACWAFSIIETIESMSAIKQGNLENLSVQQVIDCAGNGNMGCDGGDTCSLVQWLVQNKIKIQKAAAYPLVLETEICKLKRSLEGVQVATNYTCRSLIGKEEEMLSMLAHHGPVAVAVNALPWQFYLGGIIQFNCDYHLESINHAVQLVGYNLASSIPYYIVRNSWGTQWGNNGYAKLSIGNNICGVATRVAGLDVI